MVEIQDHSKQPMEFSSFPIFSCIYWVILEISKNMQTKGFYVGRFSLVAEAIQGKWKYLVFAVKPPEFKFLLSPLFKFLEL